MERPDAIDSLEEFEMPEGAECILKGCDKPRFGYGFCKQHYRHWKQDGHPLAGNFQLRIEGTADDRFWARVGEPQIVSDYRPDLGPCRLWTGSTNGVSGYGQWYHPEFGKSYAHIISYKLNGGFIPEGWQIDHLCRVRLCCEPSHLEAVTPQENLRRVPTFGANKTHCKYGHEFTEENTRTNARGYRRCRVCDRERAAQVRAKRAHQ